MGWFFGFKLHLVINDKDEIMAFKLTQASPDDKEPAPWITKIKKNMSRIEHSRHRSIHNFMVDLLSGIAAYALQSKKPSLNLRSKQRIAC